MTKHESQSVYAYQNASKKIGLLGGSFNPAHEGHIHISNIAIKRLGLDQVWWLVSPQNPLKVDTPPPPLEERLAYAEHLTKDHPNILVSNIEAELGTRYSIDTVTALKQQFKYTRFIWLMGADNLAIMHRWKRWEKLMRTVPMAIFDRTPYTRTALASPAASTFSYARKQEEESQILKNAPAPSWVFLPIRKHPESSTNIRKKAKV